MRRTRCRSSVGDGSNSGMSMPETPTGMTIHAGAGVGLDSIRRALNLGATRVSYGVRIVEGIGQAQRHRSSFNRSQHDPGTRPSHWGYAQRPASSTSRCPPLPPCLTPTSASRPIPTTDPTEESHELAELLLTRGREGRSTRS